MLHYTSIHYKSHTLSWIHYTILQEKFGPVDAAISAIIGELATRSLELISTWTKQYLRRTACKDCNGCCSAVLSLYMRQRAGASQTKQCFSNQYLEKIHVQRLQYARHIHMPNAQEEKDKKDHVVWKCRSWRATDVCIHRNRNILRVLWPRRI